MPQRAIRRALSVIFVVGIAGMIAMSIADNDGGAVTFGLVCAAAAVCLIAITSVTTGRADDHPIRFDDETAVELEDRISDIVVSGADEEQVRDLVRLAVRLGRDAR